LSHILNRAINIDMILSLTFDKKISNKKIIELTTANFSPNINSTNFFIPYAKSIDNYRQ